MTTILTILIGIFITFCVGAVWFSEHKSSKSDKVDEHAFGDDKIIGFDELCKSIKRKKTIDFKMYDITKETDDNRHETGGQVVATSENKIVYDIKDKHTLMFASSGSGKSAMVIIPDILNIASSKAKESMIIADVKGELYKGSKDYLIARGYDVKLLNYEKPIFGEQFNQIQGVNDFMKESLTSTYKYKAIEYINEDVEKNTFRDRYEDKLNQMNKRYNKLHNVILNKHNEMLAFKKKNKFRNNEMAKLLRDKGINDCLLNKQIRIITEVINYMKVISKFNSAKQVIDYLNEQYYIEKNDAYFNEAEAKKIAISIAQIIVDNDKGGGTTKGEAIWENSAKSLITAIILLITRESPDEYEKHLGSVQRFIGKYLNNSLDDKHKKQMDEIISLYGDWDGINSKYLIIGASEGNTKTSMISSGISPLDLFEDVMVSSQSLRTTINVEDIVNKPTALFLAIPGADNGECLAYTQLGALTIEQLYSKLTNYAKRCSNNRLPRNLYILLDEFGNLPRIRNFGSKLSLARSYGIRFVLSVQTVAQIDEIYGKNERRNMQTNCNYIYLSTNDMETRKEISEQIGKETIKYANTSVSSSKGGDSNSESTTQTGKPLLSPSELGKFETGENLFIQTGKTTIHTTHVGYFKIDKWKNYFDRDTSNKVLEINKRSLLDVKYFVPDYDVLEEAIVRMRDNTLFEGINLSDADDSLDITKAPLNEPKPESKPLPDEKKDDDAKELVPVQAEQQEVLDDAPIELIPEEGTRIKTTTIKQQKMAIDKVKKAFKYEVKKNINIQDMNESEKEEMMSMLSN